MGVAKVNNPPFDAIAMGAGGGGWGIQISITNMYGPMLLTLQWGVQFP